MTAFFSSAGVYLFHGLMYGFQLEASNGDAGHGPSGPAMYVFLGTAVAALLLGTLLTHPTLGFALGRCYRPKPKGPLAGAKPGARSAPVRAP